MASIAYAHLVDDEPAILQMLVYMLASEGISSMTYTSAEDMLESLVGLPPGCVLSDVRMPGMSGLELVRRLKSEAPDHPVIVMSGHADLALAIDAMRAGAVDFLVKPFGKSSLVDAVRSAMLAGSRNALKGEDVANYRKVFATLSPRQHEVLTGILDGKVNKVIAYELGISMRTVEAHRAALMMKMQAPRSGALIRMAMMAGM